MLVKYFHQAGLPEKKSVKILNKTQSAIFFLAKFKGAFRSDGKHK